MYLTSLPLWDLFTTLELNYSGRFDMFKKSLSFQSCRKNIILSYILLLLDLVWFSVNVITCYKYSTKAFEFYLFFIMVIVAAAVYLTFNLNLCMFIDWEDHLNRMRAVEVLSEETVERLENVLTNEEVENTQEISVPTRNFART